MRDEQGILENNAGRMAGWWLDPDRQLPIWEAMEMSGRRARFSLPRQHEHLGPLRLLDLEVLTVLLTLWARQPPEQRAANRVEYSLGTIYRQLGNDDPPNGERCDALRASLERLAYMSVERDWYDAKRDESVHELRRFISEADFIHGGRPGQYGRLMRGWVRFAPSVMDQLARQQYAYALDLPLLAELPSPLAKRLYLLLATDRMFRISNSKLRTVTYPLSAAFFENLGVRDVNVSRLRTKLTAAGAAICAGDPIYRSIVLKRRTGRGGGARYLLEVIRESGSSRAAEVRAAQRLAEARQVSREAAQAAAATPAIDAARLPPARSASAEEQARYQRYLRDPIKQWSFEHWLAAAGSPELELAWRSFREDHRAWFMAGCEGPMPTPPEPVPAG